jgi:hypothetical protein
MTLGTAAAPALEAHDPRPNRGAICDTSPARSASPLLITPPPTLRLVPGGQRLQVGHPSQASLSIG